MIIIISLQSIMNPANAGQVVSPFPNPPDYAQGYTTERLSNGSTFPPPPVQNDFTVFGEEYHMDEDIIRPLNAQGIKQLYPAKFDWKTEMKKLNRSAVAAFLDLIDLLIKCPDNLERVEKLNDIQTIFINMHHLINEYRPLQARDTLKLMQQEQLKELESTVERFRGYLDKGRAALREELSLDGLSLEPVPRPSPSTGVRLDSDEEADMPKLNVELASASAELPTDTYARVRAKPTVIELRERQRSDCSFIEKR